MAKLPTRNTCLQKHLYSHQEAMNPLIYRETGDLKFHSGDMASSTLPMADMDILRTEVKLWWLQSLQEQHNYLQDDIKQVHELRSVDSQKYDHEEDVLASVLKAVAVHRHEWHAGRATVPHNSCDEEGVRLWGLLRADLEKHSV